ncbi:MAG: cation transporter [Spirulinaceae cyanobacterium]
MKEMNQGEKRYRTSRLVLFVMLWLILFILSVKASAGWVTTSLSVLAECFYTLSVSFSILLSLLAITSSDRPLGKHIYGHGIRETILTFLAVALASLGSAALLWFSSQQLIAAWYSKDIPFAADVSVHLMQIIGVSGGVNLLLGILGVFQGRSLSNPALSFNGIQLIKDGVLTLVVIGGFFGNWWGLIWIDLILPIVLVLLTVVNFWQVIKWQLPLLVRQTAIAPEVLAEIALQVNGVTHCYKIQSRGIVGRLIYIQMHLVVHPDFHGVTGVIAEEIEARICEGYGPVQMTFYIDEEAEEQEILMSLSPPPEMNGRMGY